jgi:hypothetical protein
MKSNNPLHGVITDDIVRAQQERNEARLQQAREALGGGYLLHPSNQVQRNTACGCGLYQGCAKCGRYQAR